MEQGSRGGKIRGRHSHFCLLASFFCCRLDSAAGASAPPSASSPSSTSSSPPSSPPRPPCAASVGCGAVQSTQKSSHRQAVHIRQAAPKQTDEGGEGCAITLIPVNLQPAAPSMSSSAWRPTCCVWRTRAQQAGGTPKEKSGTSAKGRRCHHARPADSPGRRWAC